VLERRGYSWGYEAVQPILAQRSKWCRSPRGQPSGTRSLFHKPPHRRFARGSWFLHVLTVTDVGRSSLCQRHDSPMNHPASTPKISICSRQDSIVSNTTSGVPYTNSKFGSSYIQQEKQMICKWNYRSDWVFKG
jgi:hypothetical protein